MVPSISNPANFPSSSMAMETIKVSSFPSVQRAFISSKNPIFQIPFSQRAKPHLGNKFRNFKICPVIFSPVESSSVDRDTETEVKEDVFDWYAHWYPVVPVYDLDKRRPHGKKVMGIDVVIWWDKNENAWQVFDDKCPHRLAPLSEGRIDQWGRLQCVYHGWCFGGGGGDCKFIPQAPRDGPPVHTSKRACATVYPSCIQNGILWFWPNSDPIYKDIHSQKKPPYIPELDDPSYTNSTICRDIPYGYEILTENLMDPAHVQYAHYGIVNIGKTPDSLKADREGGIPLEISIHNLNVNGFTTKQRFGENVFVPPCLHHGYLTAGRIQQALKNTSSAGAEREGSQEKRALIISYCIPVSPGNSRLIFATPRNFAVWTERIIPRWFSHIGQNLVLDSDLYLLHMEERKLMEVGSENWHKCCYVPTKSDAKVVAYRRWLNKYAGTGVVWRDKSTDQLPPTPRREQLMDRYMTHTVSCSSCSVAHKQLQGIDVVLQVLSVVLLGIVASSKQSGNKSIIMRYSLVSMAVLCFIASKWLKNFIYKIFHYHGYDHAFR